MKLKPEWHAKGWGGELWIVNTPKYCGKLLYFNEGKKCSVHYHKLKDETFFLHSGRLEVVLAKSEEEYRQGIIERITLKPKDALYIPPGTVHQMIAGENSELFEFSTQHFEEDSYRLVKGD